LNVIYEEEDDLGEDSEQSNKDQSELDSLTVQPFSDDVLLFAVPYVAPYVCFSKVRTFFKKKLKILTI